MVDVKIASQENLKSWDKYVERSPHGTLFHRLDVLRILAEHSKGDLHPLVGFKGQEPVGIFPLFELSKGPIQTAFSPPPHLGIPFLGPALLNFEKLKQRKQERRTKRFVDGCLDWILDVIGAKYVHVQTAPEFRDPRPFSWRDFDVQPRFTYRIDVSRNSTDVLRAFSSRVRNDIKNADEGKYEIRTGTEDDLEFIIQQVQNRYEAQDRPYHITPAYATDLYRTLDDDRIRIYVGDVDGERTSGMITPRSETTVYYWQGGGKPDVSMPINDLLHWAVIEDAIASGKTQYDLVGANTPRLCKYKAKFNPELESYYMLKRGSMGIDKIADWYRKLQ